MKKIKSFNITNYIKKLTTHKMPHYVISKDSSLGLKPYKHPSDVDVGFRSMRDQTKGFYGHFDKNKTNFPSSFSPEYITFIRNIKETDKRYGLTKTIEERIDITADQNKLWHEYKAYESSLLPEHLKISESTELTLKELFQRTKRRDKQTLPSLEILPFLYDFSKAFKFEVYLHPHNLTMMVNPHWGYFCKFIGKEFTFDEIINFMKDEFISTNARMRGDELLANRITAHNYWGIMDKDSKGFLTMTDFFNLLDAMAFDFDTKDIEAIKNEFKTVLQRLPNEFLGNPTELFRFRLFEHIFLERCALY